MRKIEELTKKQKEKRGEGGTLGEKKEETTHNTVDHTSLQVHPDLPFRKILCPA